jgi:hypothetical protein
MTVGRERETAQSDCVPMWRWAAATFPPNPRILFVGGDWMADGDHSAGVCQEQHLRGIDARGMSGTCRYRMALGNDQLDSVVDRESTDGGTRQVWRTLLAVAFGLYGLSWDVAHEPVSGRRGVVFRRGQFSIVMDARATGRARNVVRRGGSTAGSTKQIISGVEA